MADSTIQKFTLIQLTGANAYAAMLASQAAAAASATAAAASAASAASAVNTAVSGTVNTIAKFSGTNAVRNSTISDDGGTVSVSATYFQLSNSLPSMVFYESDAATDSKRWQLSANNGILTLYTTNDANSASATAWQVTRSGNSITQHDFWVSGASKLRIYGDGGVQIGGTFGTGPGPGALHINGNGNTQTLRVTDTNTSTGSNIRLEGDGATTPSKYIRAKAGNLEFINSAYSAIIASLTDAGVFTATSFKAGANQVVGARDTGWAAMTGTANKATVYDTASVTLAQLAGRVMSLQAALTTHGLIGA